MRSRKLGELVIYDIGLGCVSVLEGYVQVQIPMRLLDDCYCACGVVGKS